MKTIFITGSTDGIGKIAAFRFAEAGCEVVLHGRKPEKLAQTVNELKSTTGNENIKGYLSDFSDLESVKKMADTIRQEVPKIDVLINNAGIFKSPVSTTSKGLDIRFAVNYLAPYVLTKSLLPVLKEGKSPRIINLSSAAQSSVSLNALKGNSEFSAQEAYAQSKLALTMWSFELAKNHQDIVVIAVNPGSLLNTKMVKEAYGNHWSPAEKGSNILYDLAISDEYQNSTGQYFDNDKGETKGFFAPAHPDTEDTSKIENLITTTENLLTD
ncbi:SDR family NAD(P)-dependent oxidoreductase [Maribacter algarum]|uniref:SDR family NAD(P)-dependent oxidoreductase n=1 Tax=Maribacter algarum (ex Zhang et al. 2020) TaxID=2578118 RepID=A0A5S3PQ16_9FLAO|nr:SDR family NAD(P)-dependent oxidoreductase [Maribacter algarum]TMM56840.1 SDR family NAD(P)-dependent oxidoreductase [Maribacter algarum]